MDNYKLIDGVLYQAYHDLDGAEKWWAVMTCPHYIDTLEKAVDYFWQ
jgi:hypothetical protein